MRILLLVHSFNSLSQRLYVELLRDGHELSVEFDIHDEITSEAAALYRPQVILAPFLKRAIPPSVWQSYRCLIVHPGPLGDRGPAALDWAILRAEPSWGVTVLQATQLLDAGPVWAQARFPMRFARKSSLYRTEVTEAAVLAVRTALARIAAGERPAPAPTPLPPLRPAPSAQLRAIDWLQDTTATVLRKIYSADGVPGLEDRLCGRRFRLYDASAEHGLTGAAGMLLARRDEAVCRATSDGAVWIGALQPCGAAERPFKQPATTALGPLAAPLSEIPVAASSRCAWQDAASSADPHAMALHGEISYREREAIGFLHFEFYNGAMSTAQCRRLQQAYCQARARPTRVLVLMGGTDFWSNGMHLHCIEAADSPADASWENINAIDDLAQQILCTDDKLTIAALHGNAGAGGVFLALAADRVLARSGIVLNPHYRNMGNLYGSEFWTYLLPRRLGKERAAALMQSRLPLGVEQALELGLIDAHAGPSPREFAALIEREALMLCKDEGFGARLADKHAQRAREEAQTPLSVYRAAELERMRLNFYGFDPSYHIARHRFVYRTPHAWTPRYLAAHRRIPRSAFEIGQAPRDDTAPSEDPYAHRRRGTAERV